mgnify:CR=1 FL=1
MQGEERRGRIAENRRMTTTCEPEHFAARERRVDLSGFLLMNTRGWMMALWLWMSVGVALRAEPEIEFVGVMGQGREVRVALKNKASGAAQWVPVGGRMLGYAVSSYDAKSDVLILTKDGQQFRFSLKRGKTLHAAAQPPGEVERAIMNNLRQLAAATEQFYLEHGRTSASYDDLVGPTKYVKSLTAHDGEDYRKIQFVPGKPLSVTTSNGYTVTLTP